MSFGKRPGLAGVGYDVSRLKLLTWEDVYYIMTIEVQRKHGLAEIRRTREVQEPDKNI